MNLVHTDNQNRDDVYTIEIMYNALWIENTSESDLHTKAVAKKAQKKFWGFNGIRTHDICDTSAMLYQLSYEALFQQGRSSASSIYTCYTKRVRCAYDIDHICALWIENTCERDPCNYEATKAELHLEGPEKKLWVFFLDCEDHFH